MARRKIRRKYSKKNSDNDLQAGSRPVQRKLTLKSDISVETESHIEYELVFERKFKRIEKEIDFLRTEIGLIQGGWIFSRHDYTAQELLESRRWEKIFSISEKISDDVLNWVRRGNFTTEGQETYRRRRDRVAQKLRGVNKAIKERQPTGWEMCLAVFQDAAKIVMRILPTTANLIKLARKALSSRQDSTKLLPSPVELG